MYVLHTLIHLAYRVLNAARVAYWFVARPRTAGAHCLIEHDGSFLLIRNSYGLPLWTLPGGGIRHQESPTEAVVREVREEVGISLAHVEPLGSYVSTAEFKVDTVHCFYASVPSSTYTIDNGEVMRAAWFPADALPAARTVAVQNAWCMLKERTA